MTTIGKSTELAGRILLASLFVLSGFGKLTAYAGTQAYMAHAGVPVFLLPLVILLELGGGLAIVLGFHTRLIAIAIAGFSLIAAALFHNNLQDQTQMIMFLKNISIAGGFLLLAVNGAGPFSLDARRGKV